MTIQQKKLKKENSTGAQEAGWGGCPQGHLEDQAKTSPSRECVCIKKVAKCKKQNTKFHVDCDYRYIMCICQWPRIGREQNHGEDSVGMPGLHVRFLTF